MFEHESLIYPEYEKKVVYHYCSLEALYGIITGKAIWLTSLISTNDSSELKVGRSIVDLTLKEMINDSEYSKVDYLKAILNASKDSKFKKQFPQNRFFSTSFVNVKDSLTHWDRYGNHSKGVCVGIDVGQFYLIFDKWALPDLRNTWLCTSKIIYDEFEQIALIKKYVEELIEFYLSISQKELFDNPYIFNVIYNVLVSRAIPKFKNDSFVDESEVRLYFEEGEPESNEKLFKSMISETKNSELFTNVSNHCREASKELRLRKEYKKHALIGGNIRSLYSLNLEPFWSDKLITEVIIGPKCYQNKKELKEFLKSNGLHKTKVSISEIPYR